MGSKGNKRHLKRFAAASVIQIPRKQYTFFMKARPGPHALKHCLPLGHVIRDLLKLSQNMHETKYILNQRLVLVDKKVRTNPRFPIGLMDVIEFTSINKSYRVLPSKQHGLYLSEITKDEAMFKLARIENITTVKKGNLQLNLHDGRNIKIDVKNATKKPKIPYKTLGTLKISIPEQEILEYYPFEEGSQAIIFQGKNIGVSGTISSIVKRFGVNASILTIGEINTAYDYTFIIGKDESAIDLPIA